LNVAQEEPPLSRRLLWFAIYWVAGVAAVGAVAFALRWLLR
jgi:hypothetical protein